MKPKVPTNPAGQDFYVWVLDFTGITIGACNPRLAAATNKVTAKHYPERLGYTVVVNAPWIFNATWVAIKAFADAKTVSKFLFVKQHNMEEIFREKFPDDLTDWLMTEIKVRFPFIHSFILSSSSSFFSFLLFLSRQRNTSQKYISRSGWPCWAQVQPNSFDDLLRSSLGFLTCGAVDRNILKI